MSSTAWLKVAGDAIRDGAGGEVLLRGIGLGGWMNMENFITGYPGTETNKREALASTLGREGADRFFDRFLYRFFTAEDADFLASLGVNLVRLPFHYHHFESDDRPGIVRPEGFAQLDRVVELCAQRGMHTILDLHAVPGYQNQDWHSDNPTHRAFFWQYREFQDRVIHLWEVLADHYRDQPWVAGYNPLNEPDGTRTALRDFYNRLVPAIRAVDPRHILFLDGNRYSTEFDAFGEPAPNTVYTVHDYALPGYADGGPYPGESRGVFIDRDVVEKTFFSRTRYSRETGTPIWVGEFGPVYNNEEHTEARYALLEDQLEIYERYRASWAIWTYKDVGLQGLVSVRPDTPWMRLLAPLLSKKERLCVDRWGSDEKSMEEFLAPIDELIEREFPEYDPYPFGARQRTHRIILNILLAEPLVGEFGQLFRGLGLAEVDALADSFSFGSCAPRQRLCDILARALHNSRPAPRAPGNRSPAGGDTAEDTE